MLAGSQLIITLPSTDLARSREFYVEKLGLKEMPGPGLVVGNDHGTLVQIYERAGGNNAEHTSCAFVVNDLEATIHDLNTKGIAMERFVLPGSEIDEIGIVSSDNGRAAWFKDPDGAIIGLYHVPGA